MMRKFLNLCRTLHIYLTLAVLLLLLFFAATGFIANHDDWFGISVRSERQATGKIDPATLAKADRLEVVERLRKDHDIRLGVNSYEPEDQSIRVVFKGPGRMVETDIDRASGEVKLRFETRGFAGFIADLHKGANTGRAWRLVIDIVAILLTFGSLTGLILWMSMPGRRVIGIVSLILGTVATLTCMLLCV